MGACPFVQIFDLGIKGYGLPLHPRVFNDFRQSKMGKKSKNAWVQAPTLRNINILLKHSLIFLFYSEMRVKGQGNNARRVRVVHKGVGNAVLV